MVYPKRSNSTVASVVLRDEDLINLPTTHEVLYMIPSTKYQYELDGEKILAHEYDDIQQQPTSSHYHHHPTNGDTSVNQAIQQQDGRFVVTPDLTISSTNSLTHHREGITLVDNPVPFLVEEVEEPTVNNKKNNKFSLFVTKLKSIFSFSKPSTTKV